MVTVNMVSKGFKALADPGYILQKYIFYNDSKISIEILPLTSKLCLIGAGLFLCIYDSHPKYRIGG